MECLLNLPADPPPWMKKDETHLQEQLVNALLSHAAKERMSGWLQAQLMEDGGWMEFGGRRTSGMRSFGGASIPRVLGLDGPG